MSLTPELDIDVREPLDTDFLGAFAEAADADRAAAARVRQTVTPMLDELAEAWHEATYPVHLVRQVAAAGLLTDGVDVDGFETLTPLGAGLVTMELSRLDGSLAAACAVQGGLALRSVVELGSAEQRAAYAQKLARGELLGAFALTEPEHGSDSVALETTARKVDGGWVLNGRKKWIGNGAAGGVTIVWARDEDGQVRGFIMPQEAAGYSAEPIVRKGVLRALHQSLITLDSVQVGDDALLPGAHSFADTARVLEATRVNIGWSALGHATALFEGALQYTKARVQFGRPLAAQQSVQERLSQMLEAVTSMQLQAAAVARLQASGRMRGEHASMLKYHNTRAARRVAGIARDLMGGNGLLLEHGMVQHFADLEALHTYEGTETVQSLIMGRRLTGHSAYGWANAKA